ncbi:ATP-grasp domain-containing protein [Bacillus thuringiensis]|uniref:ATP-grasp domain-containing protein n=1 Tax=Bacillus thuringiensis TaxID=1428 RepID=UPI000B43D66C|nr:ATP-grasp domain-containing protein [Bacillus thuringiensis]MED3183379.1 ATP-grasp domain-containing protein [Bacillus thuringiensis]OTY05672.1 hypothetical protein BK734_22750 [Bacillus thuringiensis serovar kim]OUB14608.1 hypothetical protein BK733_23590 [Bacillus thuringiensis serovar xiaguangiensis]
MSKHVLVIGSLRIVHRKLKNLGARLTIFVERESGISEEDRELYDRIVEISKYSKAEEWVSLAMTIHEFDPIDAVGAYHEYHQDKAAMIAEKIGFPFNSLETIELVNNKYKMRERLRKAKVDPTASIEINSADDIKKFAKEYGYPVVLKPLDGWASIGVSLIKSDKDINNALNWFNSNAVEYKMYAEQYLEGKEYSVEAFSENGTHNVICITEKFKYQEHFVEQGHCLPATMSEIEQKQIYTFIEDVLNCLDIKFGGTHTEIIVTEDGPRIVETHTRLGGDFIPDLINLVFKLELFEMWAKHTLGEEIINTLPTSIPNDKFAAIWYTTPNAIGELEKIEGREDALSVDGVSQVVFSQTKGAKLNGTQDSFGRTAYVIAAGKTREEALERAKKSCRKIKFTVLCQG